MSRSSMRPHTLGTSGSGVSPQNAATLKRETREEEDGLPLKGLRTVAKQEHGSMGTCADER